MGKKQLRNVFVPNGFCVVNDTLWFVQSMGNRVVNVDINTFEILDIVTLPEKNYDFRAIFDKIFFMDDKLIIILYGKRYIYTYSLKTKELKKISDIFEKYPVYCNAIASIDEMVIFFPGCGNPLIEYDCKRDCAIVRKIDGYENQIVARNIEIYDGYIYGVDRFAAGVVYEYDLERGNWNKLFVGNKVYSAIKKENDYFVLSYKDGVTLWKKETGEMIELDDFYGESYFDGKQEFLDVHKYNHYVYLVQKNTGGIWQVDTDRKNVKCIFEAKCIGKGNIYLETIAHKGKIYAGDSIRRLWDVFDLTRNIVESKDGIEIPNDIFNDMVQNILIEMNKGNWYGVELGQGFYDLENFVLLITMGEGKLL